MKTKPFSSFFNWSREEQASFIERETKKLISRLPTLKKNLQMYGEVSDELYNLNAEEIDLIGTTYSRAVRRGEVSTPSSQRAYNKFVNDLRKYARMDMKQLAIQTSEKRLDSWLEHLKANGSDKEVEYAQELLNSMTDEQKMGFTLSKFFLDVANWSSEGFIKNTDEGEYSEQVLELELYCEKQGIQTRNIYNRLIATDGLDIDRVGKHGVMKKKG